MCLNLHLGSSKGQLITSENDKLQEDHLAHTQGPHRDYVNSSLGGEISIFDICSFQMGQNLVSCTEFVKAALNS